MLQNIRWDTASHAAKPNRMRFPKAGALQSPLTQDEPSSGASAFADTTAPLVGLDHPCHHGWDKSNPLNTRPAPATIATTASSSANQEETKKTIIPTATDDEVLVPTGEPEDNTVMGDDSAPAAANATTNNTADLTARFQDGMD